MSYSAMLRRRTTTIAATMPGQVSGITTLAQIRAGEAPSVAAARSRFGSIRRIAGMISSVASGVETCIMPMKTPRGVPRSPPSSIPKRPATQPAMPRLARIRYQAKVRTISPIRKGTSSSTRSVTLSARRGVRMMT